MKKLIALAAVLGLAVSSWGLTPQQGPEAQAASALSTSVVLDAQIGRGLASVTWSWVATWGFQYYVTQQAYELFMMNVMAVAGAAAGGMAGTSLGPVGTIVGAGIGAGLGAF